MNLRSLAIWVVIGVALVGLYGMMNQGAKTGGAQEVSYSHLLSQIDSGHVKRAVLRTDSIDAFDSDNKNPITAATPQDQGDLVKRLEANGEKLELLLKRSYEQHGVVRFLMWASGLIAALGLGDFIRSLTR